jgi:hypothetical protein
MNPVSATSDTEINAIKANVPRKSSRTRATSRSSGRMISKTPRTSPTCQSRFVLSRRAVLLERARAADAEAWDRIVGLYGPLVFHWCRRWDLQEQDTTDVFQVRTTSGRNSTPPFVSRRQV